VFVFLFALVSVYASAAIVNGSVGNKGQKKYSLKPGANGWANILLTNSVAATDLDLFVTFVDSNGAEQGLGGSSSAVRQIEKLTLGVDSVSQFYIYVSSFSGSSAYRLAVTVEGDVSGSAQPGKIELREVPIDAQSRTVIERAQKLQRLLKQ
jgi:hypothetical protein